ncbi:hypothetical protein RF11_12778 [Thelohanellus kitauei]|uniref:C2H2-type domain-containing protein n=1 Tax=Thelohanellus kitauei TaxID=669202 RepID=A0A0C2MAK7_THEKT|nr:hypothetical protein RF11_12778 [Thelohanellus kitauei]
MLPSKNIAIQETSSLENDLSYKEEPGKSQNASLYICYELRRSPRFAGRSSEVDTPSTYNVDETERNGGILIQSGRYMKNIRKFRCRRRGCYQYFYCELSLKSHYANDHSFPCALCDEKFANYSFLRKHVSVAHPKQYICDKCGIKVYGYKEVNRRFIDVQTQKNP